METGELENGREIWVVTDGNAGNEAQALGLAEALARRVAARIVVRRVALRPPFRRLPQAAMLAPGARAGGWPFSALTDRAALDGAEAASAVISAGRRGAVFAAALRRVLGTPAVAILNPQMPLGRFDAVVVPAHDRLSGPNVIETVGAPNRLTPEAVAAVAEQLGPEWRGARPRLAAMIGGPSRSARFGAKAVEALLADLARFEAAGWSIGAVTSRRTPAGVADRVRERFPGAAVWSGEGANPYPGLLGLADAALVTEDSVNMASEAATVGLPVFVSGLGRISRKLKRFHEALAGRGCSRPASEAPELWSYEPLREADRVVEMLAGRLFGG